VDLDSVRDDLATVVRRDRGPPCPGADQLAPEARVCRFATAVLTRRQAPGDRDEALAALAAAAREAGQLGMVTFTEWIGQLQAQLTAAPAGGSPLSPRDLEVARLVAQGLTNKRIGQTLYISERTAENHVQHILAKLGLRNRSQIAAWAIGEHDASRL
jgi:DNA-binding NarL/FixJ family response regulator